MLLDVLLMKIQGTWPHFHKEGIPKKSEQVMDENLWDLKLCDILQSWHWKNKITRKIRSFIKGEPESLHSKNNFEPMNRILSLKNVQF